VTGSLLLVGWSQAVASDLLPAAKYAAILEASVIRMSPDGHKFAMTESIAGKQVLAIQDVDARKRWPILATSRAICVRKGSRESL
jgi:hypothetical protein